MTETNTLKIRCFCHWSILISVIVWRKLHFVSDFEFLTEKTEIFGQALPNLPPRPPMYVLTHPISK